MIGTSVPVGSHQGLGDYLRLGGLGDYLRLGGYLTAGGGLGTDSPTDRAEVERILGQKDALMKAAVWNVATGVATGYVFKYIAKANYKKGAKGHTHAWVWFFLGYILNPLRARVEAV